MNAIALDLGQTCGWAIITNGKIRSGIWDLKPTKFESAGIKFLKFKRQLELEIILGGVDKVFFESVRAHRGTDAAHAYGGYLSHLQSVCIECDVSYEGVAVSTIKKHATGNHIAKKEVMVEAAIRKFRGINIIDDNHADALHLLDYIITHK